MIHYIDGEFDCLDIIYKGNLISIFSIPNTKKGKLYFGVMRNSSKDFCRISMLKPEYYRVAGNENNITLSSEEIDELIYGLTSKNYYKLYCNKYCFDKYLYDNPTNWKFIPRLINGEYFEDIIPKPYIENLIMPDYKQLKEEGI